MTAVEAAPAMPLATAAAVPLAEIPPVEMVSIAPAATADENAADEGAADPVTPVADTVFAATDPVSDTITITTTQKESIMDATTATTAATEKTQAFFADASERTQGAFQKSTQFFQDVTEFSKGNVEAIVESSKIAARGFETMGQDAAAYAKTSFETASQALRTLGTLKSPTEFVKFQSDYVRSVFDSVVAQTSRGTEATLKLAGEVAQPISNRVAVAAEKLKIVA